MITGLPSNTIRVDWAKKGTFDGAYDTVTALLPPTGRPIKFDQGASADFGKGDIVGEFSFDLDDRDHAYDPDRNLAVNAIFDAGTDGWAIFAVPSLTAAATSLTQVADAPTGAGTKSGEAVLTATLNSGIFFELPFRALQGVAISGSVALKSMSGTLNVRAGIADYDTPSDRGSTAGNITTGWVEYPFSWTPAADRDRPGLFLRTNTASAATVRIGKLRLNIGSALNPWVLAPTSDELVPGRPVHFYTTKSGVDRAWFYGTIDTITPDPENEKVSIVCGDILQTMSETPVVVPVREVTVGRTARSMRIDALDDFARGSINLVGHNPDFAVDTSHWTVTGGTLTRSTADHPPGAIAYGSYVATTGGQQISLSALMAPILFDGQTYQGGFYLKADTGSTSWQIALGGKVRDIVVDGQWRRYSVSETLAATLGGGGLNVRLISAGAGTIRVGNASITRGEALYPYDPLGSGRYANWIRTGIEGGEGWGSLFSNLIPNPRFASNTTGWTNATRSTAAPFLGAAAGLVNGSGTVASISPTGTSLSGVTYRTMVAVRAVTGGANITAELRSSGTPADTNSVVDPTITTAYSWMSFDWTPSANRADPVLRLSNSGVQQFYIGAVQTVRVDSRWLGSPDYSDVGPAAGGSPPTNFSSGVFADAPYGSYGQMTTPAVAGAGMLYDLFDVGGVLADDQPFILQMSVRPKTTNWAYKVGLSANKDDGSWDEATTTGTATHDVWNVISVPFTPAADRSASAALRVVASIQQTAATARDASHIIQWGGVRLIPGTVLDDVELPQWVIPITEGVNDIYLPDASLQGDALSVMRQLNALTQSRMWSRATMADPFYEIAIEDRDTFATKTPTVDIVEAINGWTNLQIDRNSIINTIRIEWDGDGDYISDDWSVGQFGPRLGATIDGGEFFPDRRVPDLIAAALLPRYSKPRRSPQLVLIDDFTTILAVDLNDVITGTIARFLLRSRPFVVLRATLEISPSWKMTYRLEEYPY